MPNLLHENNLRNINKVVVAESQLMRMFFLILWLLLFTLKATENRDHTWKPASTSRGARGASSSAGTEGSCLSFRPGCSLSHKTSY